MKKVLRLLLVLVLFSILFRGSLYRWLVDYQVTSYRTIDNSPSVDIQLLSDSLFQDSEHLEDFVLRVQQYTTQQLVFREKNSGQSADQILAGGQANCVGYARVAAALIAAKLDQYPGAEVRHGVAKMSMMGFDLHAVFTSPFFRDHDVVEVVNGQSTFLIDPSLCDYTAIRRVKGE